MVEHVQVDESDDFEGVVVSNPPTLPARAAGLTLGASLVAVVGVSAVLGVWEAVDQGDASAGFGWFVLVALFGAVYSAPFACVGACVVGVSVARLGSLRGVLVGSGLVVAGSMTATYLANWVFLWSLMLPIEGVVVALLVRWVPRCAQKLAAAAA